MKDKLHIVFLILLGSVFTIGIGYLLIGAINTKPDQILSRDSESIIVKEYKWNNRDSVIYRYPADKIYTAIVIDKERYSHYVGLPGKGGHSSTSYYITISGNNTQHRIQSSNLYYKYNKGNRVKVKEVWYPRHNVTVY